MTHSSPSRIPPKPILLFLVQALALFFLIGHWPTPKDAYPALFQAHANAVFGLLPDHTVELGPAPESGGSSPEGRESQVDTAMTGRVRGVAGPGWTSTFSANRIGYWPLAALAALILATPMTSWRRLAALCGGLLLLDATTLARVGVEVAYAFAELTHGPGGDLRGFGHLLLRVGSEALTATVPSLAAVLVVWVLVARPAAALDLGLLRRLLSQRAPAPGATGEGSGPGSDLPLD